MFQISKTKTYFWPVKIETPTETGEPIVETFQAEFTRMGADEIAALMREGGGVSMADATDLAFVGWRDIVDGETALEVNADNRKRLLNVTGMRAAILEAWLDSITGSEARRKN